MRRRCQHCAQMFNAVKAIRKYCSRRCCAAARPKSSFQAAGRKGAEARKEPRLRALIAKYQPLAEQCPTKWDAFKAGAYWQRRRMTSTADSRARRAGYAEGYKDGSNAALCQARYEAVMRRAS